MNSEPDINMVAVWGQLGLLLLAIGTVGWAGLAFGLMGLFVTLGIWGVICMVLSYTLHRLEENDG